MDYPIYPGSYLVRRLGLAKVQGKLTSVYLWSLFPTYQAAQKYISSLSIGVMAVGIPAIYTALDDLRKDLELWRTLVSTLETGKVEPGPMVLTLEEARRRLAEIQGITAKVEREVAEFEA